MVTVRHSNIILPDRQDISMVTAGKNIVMVTD